MKILRTLIVVFSFAVLFTACAENESDQVVPATVNEDLTQFDVVSTDGGDDTGGLQTKDDD